MGFVMAQHLRETGDASGGQGVNGPRAEAVDPDFLRAEVVGKVRVDFELVWSPPIVAECHRVADYRKIRSRVRVAAPHAFIDDLADAAMMVMTELPQPLAVRRLVCFSEAVYTGECSVEGVTARRVIDPTDTLRVLQVLSKGHIAVLIDAEGVSGRVTIQSFDWRTLLLVQRQAPMIPTVYLTLQKGSAPTIALDKATSWTAGFNPADHGGSLPRTIKAAGGTIWSPYFGDVTAALVSEAHDAGLRVVVWTVNKTEDMARMIELGVDGIISDRPDLLRQAAGDKGIALPAATPVSP